jgi:hypothetical protein
MQLMGFPRKHTDQSGFFRSRVATAKKSRERDTRKKEKNNQSMLKGFSTTTSSGEDRVPRGHQGWRLFVRVVEVVCYGS